LKRIRHAKDIWATEYRRVGGDTPAFEHLQFYFKDYAEPRCPLGGTYTYGILDHWPKCSIPGHLLEEAR